MKQDTNQSLPNQIEILHLMPGRIRLRIGEDCSKEQLTMISQYLQYQPVIKSVQIKEITKNLVITFDPEQLSLAQIQEYLASLNLFLPSSEDETKEAKLPKVTTHEVILSLFPPLLSWLIIKRLSLSGWQAIAIYLLTTGVIEGITEQLWSELSNSFKEKLPSTNEKQASSSLVLSDN